MSNVILLSPNAPTKEPSTLSYTFLTAAKGTGKSEDPASFSFFCSFLLLHAKKTGTAKRRKHFFMGFCLILE
jgi:hypothetical protein